MTRKQAIKYVATVIGVGLASLQKSGAQSFTLESGDLRPVFKLEYGEVQKDPPSNKAKYENNPPLVVTKYKPDTATILVDMKQIKTYTFVNGDNKLVITREEMWEALNS